MLKLLRKTIGRSFYTQHAGFFLFVFYLLFGAVDPAQMLHFQQSLLFSITSSLPAALGFCFILFMYGLKTGLFVRKLKQMPSYQFVKETAALPVTIQWLNWLKLYMYLFLPLTIYTLLLTVAGIYQENYLNVLIIVFVCSLLFVLLARLSVETVHHTPEKSSTALNNISKSPFFCWRFQYLFKKQTIMFFACKILSLLVFKGIVWVLSDTEGSGKYYIGLVAALLAHTVLIADIQKFNTQQLNFTTSLPINHWNRYTQLAVFFLLLFLPELMMFSLIGTPQALDIAAACIFCLSGSLSCYLLLFWASETYLYVVFMLFTGWMVAILFNVVLEVSVVLLALAFLSHWRLYQRSML